MASFFIDRPIFAWVIAITIMLVGLLSVVQLPVALFPDVAPPEVVISASYSGASAETIENNVVQVIEQSMTGLDHLLYMRSQSSSAGVAKIILTFASGTDADIAQVQVQNKLQRALPLLPESVTRRGVQVNKASSAFSLVTGLISPDGSYQAYDLADFFVSSLRDPLSRIEGVGSLSIFGAQYAMRIWLDPHKLNSYHLTPADVVGAVRAQNSQVAVGSLGGTPAVDGQQTTATMTARTLMSSPEEFSNILVKVNADGSQVRLKDIARVEIGAENYSVITRFNGKPAVGAGIMLATGANALETVEKVRAKLDELKQYFPPGIDIIYPYDTTKFIKVSITEVMHTLIEAIVLVFLVMLLFLQNFRATLIPTITVPVVLLGTFGMMAACGFSVNTLTMFGLVLAIGLLVDDAIVVVENVERIMAEEGLSPLEATRKTMRQITGALVGIALVLSAVFVPMAFFGGSTGVIYRQFSITIVSAMVLSVVVALVLTPALCATILKPHVHGEGKQIRFWVWFNNMFETGRGKYRRLVYDVVRRTLRFSLFYLILLGGIVLLFLRLPTSFVPTEDQGVMLVMVQLPAGASLERTQTVMDKMRMYYEEHEKESVASVFTIAGFSFAGQGQNMGLAFVQLKDWSERKRQEQGVDALVRRSMGAFSQIKEARVFAFNVPPIPSLGNAAGFDVFLQDRGGMGHEKLIAARNQVLGMAFQNPVLTSVRPNGMEDVPEFSLHIDYEKALVLGLRVEDVDSALGLAWGSAYVNDFINQGKIKKVYVQADAPYRMRPEDINLWYLRNKKGEMVPFSSIATASWSFGSPRLERFNASPAVEIVGSAAPGKSSGDAMKAIAAIMDKLPEGFGFAWAGMSYQEAQSGSRILLLYAVSILVVFLSLAALYESWTVPFSVLMAVPLGILGALLATWLRGLENDVYFQVGLLTTIGLSAKNAILIVEFAKRRVDKGRELIDATVRAADQRLRPILMTSLAFMLGVLPLAVSTGAGANSRHAIGTSVLGGMISATVLAIVFVPVFFVVIMRFFSRPSGEVK